MQWKTSLWGTCVFSVIKIRQQAEFGKNSELECVWWLAHSEKGLNWYSHITRRLFIIFLKLLIDGLQASPILIIKHCQPRCSPWDELRGNQMMLAIKKSFILGSYVSVEVHGSFDIFPANPLIIFYKLKWYWRQFWNVKCKTKIHRGNTRYIIIRIISSLGEGTLSCWELGRPRSSGGKLIPRWLEGLVPVLQFTDPPSQKEKMNMVLYSLR